jgi:Na+/proline symporter
MWSQPQIMQRHFALKSRAEARRIIPIVMLVLTVLLGSAYFVGGMSRLLVDPDIASPDLVIPAIVRMVLPEIGIQLFALAVVSAALSTASAILHVACGTLGQDLAGRRLTGRRWHLAVALGALASGTFAVYSSSIIALICATSWPLVAAATWLPYMALLVGGVGIDARCGWMASLLGACGALGWYFLGYAPTSLGLSGMAAPGLVGHLHPMLVGISASACGLAAGFAMRRAPEPGAVKM